MGKRIIIGILLFGLLALLAIWQSPDNPVQHPGDEPIITSQSPASTVDSPAPEPAPLDSRTTRDSDTSRAKRSELVQPRDLPFAIRIEQTLQIDPATGEERVLRSLEMAADRLVVRARPGVAESQIAALAARIGAVVERRFGERPLYELRFLNASLDTVPEGLARISATENLSLIAYVEPNYIVHTFRSPDDPRFLDGTQWSLNNTGQNAGTVDVDIDAPEGWEMRTDASSVIVAVIDSGINYLHEDLIPSLWTNPSEIPDNGLDDDENGYIDDVYGINAATGSGDPYDDNGHGSHCSGIVGASGNNGIGIAGVAWQTRLMGLKFLGASGSGTTADAVACVDYAVAMGAGVINASWGGGGFSRALLESIENATASGVVFVAAAGNAVQDTDQSPVYPASYDLPGIVTVASHTRLSALSVFSNYGLQSVDIAAPGSDILSCWKDGQDAYKTLSGTSMAAPHVSGIFALLMAEYPGDSVFEQINRLLYTRDGDSGYESKLATGGRANLQAALNAVEVPYPPVVTSHPPKVIRETVGSALSFSVEVSSDLPVTYQWFRDEDLMVGEVASRLEFDALARSDSGTYRLEARNADGSAVVFVDLEVLSPIPAFGPAVEMEGFEWFTYGNAVWEVYPFDSVAGSSSLRSGSIDDNEESVVIALGHGPGELSFDWRLSAESHYDVASLWINGEQVAGQDVLSDWVRVVVLVEEEGPFRAEWRFEKDGSISIQQDALFLDDVVFEVLGERPPTVLRQPRGATVAPGGTASFEVQALGSELRYQWYLKGEAIADATLRTLALEAVDDGFAGDVYVVVSNRFGDTSSSVVPLVVAEIPARIVAQPIGLSVKEGELATLSIEAGGSTPIAYQWSKDGEDLVGAMGSSISFPSAHLGDAGIYHVRVWNAFNAVPVVSEMAELEVRSVRLGPVFVKHPQSSTKQAGQSVELSGLVEGSLPIMYQWFKDGDAIDGATDRFLRIASAQVSDSGRYFLQVTNGEGMANSRAASLQVIAGIGAALDLDDREWRFTGNNFFFSQSEVTSDGIDALRSGPPEATRNAYAQVSTTIEGPISVEFSWRIQSSDERGEILAFIDSVTAARLEANSEWRRETIWLEPGEHDVSWFHFQSSASAVWLDAVALIQAPIIYRQPAPLVSGIGQSATLTVLARGPGTLGYQWFRSVQAIVGATGARLRIENVAAGSAGQYTVSVVNEYGTVLSESVELEVLSDVIGEVTDGSVLPEFSESSTWRWRRDPARAGDLALVAEGDSDAAVSWMELVVEGPANLSFDWRLEGDACCPKLRLLLNDQAWRELGASNEALEISRWNAFAARLEAGPQSIRFAFDPADESSRIWIDNVRLTRNPLIEEQPQDKTLVERESAILVCKAIGDTPILYQWYHDELPIADATNSNLNLQGVSGETSGRFFCVATDSLDRPVTSRVAQVEVLTDIFNALELEVGSVSQSGPAYWRRQNAVSWDGEDALALALPAGEPDVARLQIEYENPTGRVRATSLRLRVEGLAPQDNVVVTSPDGVRQGVDTAGEWIELFMLGETSMSQRVSVSVTRTGSTSVEPLQVWVDRYRFVQEPRVIKNPVSIAVTVGSSARFSAGAVGDPTLRYQWRRDGEALAFGSGQSDLERASVTLNDAGVYDLQITNAYGEATTSGAILRVLDSRFEAAIGASGLGLRMSGDAFWDVSDIESQVGQSALRVGGLDVSGSVTLATSIVGPATLRFRWKLDDAAAYGDVLYMAVGNRILRFLNSDDSGWREEEIVMDSGEHELRWILERFSDEGGSSNVYAWLDAIRLTRPAGERFETWKTNAFAAQPGLSEAEKGLYADPDLDGIPNVAEYALGLDPVSASSMPIPSVERDESGFEVSVSFRPRSGADDIAYELEISRDGKQWYPVVSDSSDTGSERILRYRLKVDELNSTTLARLAVHYLWTE